jgi:hypothetical protein
MKCERCEKEIPEELYSITERGLMLSATGHWAPFSFCKSCKKELDSWFFEYGKHRCDERMNDNENKTTLSAEKTTITDGDLIPRQAVITMLNKIENAVEDGDGFQFNEWIEYAKDIPSAEKTAEWCHECKEYDKEKHCCPRFNKVIRQTVKEMKEQTDGDLISRQDAIKCFNIRELKFKNKEDAELMKHYLELSFDDLAKLPSAEKTAEWIKQKSGDKLFPEEIVCSKCYHSNSHLDFDEHYNPIGKVFLKSKYCPNCGAKMKGVE